MKALIIEDKAYIRKGLRNLLQMLDSEVQILGECESVNEALVVTKACQPDLIFLDINLVDGTAFDFLEQIGEITFKVIFITAHEEYALQALKIGAVDYLLKPIDLEELELALEKIKRLPVPAQQQQIKTVKQVWNKSNERIILSLHDSFQVIELSKLLYCKSDKGYTYFFCVDQKKYVVSKTLKEFEEQLGNANFVRTHQSYLVNLDYVNKYDKTGMLYLTTGEQIPVSFRKRDVFLKKFLHSKDE